MAAGPIPFEFDVSLLRSPHRRRLLMALSSLGEASIGQLGRHTGLSWTRVKWLLYGHPPYYSVELSLVGAGMAIAIAGRRRRAVAITVRGRRKARSIASKWTREGLARAFVREQLRRDGEALAREAQATIARLSVHHA